MHKFARIVIAFLKVLLLTMENKGTSMNSLLQRKGKGKEDDKETYFTDESLLQACENPQWSHDSNVYCMF